MALAKYSFNSYSRLANSRDKLLTEGRAQFLSILDEGKLVAQVALQASVDAVDTASRSLAASLVMRKDSWLQFLRFQREVQKTTQGLPFD